MLNLYRLVPEKVTSAVLLLHGLGANGQDLMGLGEAWSSTFPSTAFFSPDAPEPCDMAPFGYQWFSLRNWTEASITDGLIRARPIVDKMIDDLLKEFLLPPSAFVLGGFSQGAMLSLHTALHRKEPLAGVLAYSGALFGAEKAISKPPVLLVHGLEDTVVPCAGSKRAKESLEKEKVPVELHFIHGLGHGIDGEGLDLGARFLQRVFGGS